MSFFLDESRDELILYISTFSSDYKLFRCSPDAETVQHSREQILSIEEPSTTNQSSKALQQLHEDLADELSEFDFEHGLCNTAVMKTWGLTSSLMSSWIAACISLHPGDLLEYTIGSREKSIITFTCQSSAVLNRCETAAEAARCMPHTLISVFFSASGV